MKTTDKPLFSPAYLEWVKQSKLKNLTNQQHAFAEFCLDEKNAEIIAKQPSSKVFNDIRTFLRK